MRRSNSKSAVGHVFRQADESQQKIAKLLAKNDRIHADLKRSQTSERIACEEADHMREQVVVLESMVSDLRSERGHLGRTIGALRVEIAEARQRPWRLVWERISTWARGGWMPGSVA